MAFKMTSLALRKCLLPTNKVVLSQIIHRINTTPIMNYADAKPPDAKPPDEKPKDSAVKTVGGKNRIQRQEPGKVIWYFVPVEWVDFFYEKTGVTGFYTFVVTFGCYIVSKEKLVMEHEYYGGLGMLLYWILAVKYLGPHFADWLDKDIDKYEADWNTGRDTEKRMLNEDIANEKVMQKHTEANLLVVAAQREAIVIQQELEYRERFMKVYRDVLQRLNYQTKLGFIQRQYIQKNMLEWIRKEVLKVVTPDWNTKYVDDCINILEKMPKPT